MIGAIIIAIFAVVLFAGLWKSRPSPISEDARRKRDPLVTDRKLRDAVLKQKFKAHKVPDSLDAVVIGSGAGGLTTAAVLARAGKRVLVLEQHDQAGGCCHTFTEKGFEFDTGIHYVGEMDGRSLFSTAIDQITEGQVNWVKMENSFDVVALGSPGDVHLYPMKSGADDYFTNLISMFPEERLNINRYRAIVEKIVKQAHGPVVLKMLPKWLAHLFVCTGLYNLLFGDYLKYSRKTLQTVLDQLTDNKELKTVLGYICGDYGLLPSDAPFTLHALVVGHYRDGAYYPEGGTSEISFHMTRVIQKYGGSVLVQAPVSKILISDGRAVGVRVGSKSSDDVDIFANVVISDAGARNTFKTLLPKDVAQTSSFYSLVDELGASGSYFTVFCGLAASPSDLGLKAVNYWAYTTTDIDVAMSEFLSQDVEDAAKSEVPIIYISSPSAKDPSWEDRMPGKSSVLLITFAPWRWFSAWKDERDRHRGERYNELKNAIAKQMWKQAVSLFPQFDGQLEYMEVGTPVTNSFYLGSPLGEMYGMDQRVDRHTTQTSIDMRPETGIPGLLMTGQDVYMAGFISVVMSGLLTAGVVLDTNLIKDIERLQKTTQCNKQAKKST